MEERRLDEATRGALSFVSIVESVFVVPGCFFVTGDRFAWNRMFPCRPITEVDELAAFAAKRPKFLRRSPWNLFAAIRAADFSERFSFHQKRQRVNSKGTFSLVCTGFSLVLAVMKRIVKRCLPPLISAK